MMLTRRSRAEARAATGGAIHLSLHHLVNFRPMAATDDAICFCSKGLGKEILQLGRAS